MNCACQISVEADANTASEDYKRLYHEQTRCECGDDEACRFARERDDARAERDHFMALARGEREGFVHFAPDGHAERITDASDGLDCPLCGGSGHVEDAEVRRKALEAERDESRARAAGLEAEAESALDDLQWLHEWFGHVCNQEHYWRLEAYKRGDEADKAENERDEARAENARLREAGEALLWWDDLVGSDWPWKALWSEIPDPAWSEINNTYEQAKAEGTAARKLFAALEDGNAND